MGSGCMAGETVSARDGGAAFTGATAALLRVFCLGGSPSLAAHGGVVASLHGDSGEAVERVDVGEVCRWRGWGTSKGVKFSATSAVGELVWVWHSSFGAAFASPVGVCVALLDRDIGCGFSTSALDDTTGLVLRLLREMFEETPLEERRCDLRSVDKTLLKASFVV